ncbi:uncharacterized protein LOC130789041 [Actinidia eriantha]|uniref:uncharacterized protein LOC130789041 n=1 Tax=Actinidia eriantha TaxID=165200 RepID=UPI0025902C5C|nr:uncharacterized protein LOC130789041 [Actinidia eriantha]
MSQIQYSEKYFDDIYDYRHVVLPPEVAKLLAKNWLSLKHSDTKMGLSFTKLLSRMIAKKEMCILMVGNKKRENKDEAVRGRVKTEDNHGIA